MAFDFLIWPRGWHYLRMSERERAVVVAVCGSPGAGKTTVASATARRLGVPFLTRDEIKAGLGLSSASVDDGAVRLDRDFHIAGGPFSLRAEAVMVDAVIEVDTSEQGDPLIDAIETTVIALIR